MLRGGWCLCYRAHTFLRWAAWLQAAPRSSASTRTILRDRKPSRADRAEPVERGRHRAAAQALAVRQALRAGSAELEAAAQLEAAVRARRFARPLRRFAASIRMPELFSSASTRNPSSAVRNRAASAARDRIPTPIRSAWTGGATGDVLPATCPIPGGAARAWRRAAAARAAARVAQVQPGVARRRVALEERRYAIPRRAACAIPPAPSRAASSTTHVAAPGRLARSVTDVGRSNSLQSRAPAI
jgi:hypothetical protein